MNKLERENVAANAVASVLNRQFGWAVAPSKWDDGSADRMHDFYLESDDAKIALEVSTIADGNRVGRDFRWDAKVPDQLIAVDGLEGVWLAMVESSAEADDVVRVISTHMPALASLAATTIDTLRWQDHWFTASNRRPAEFEPMLALHQAGVSNVSRIENPSAAALLDLGGKVQVLRAHGHTRPADRNFPVAFLNEQLTDADLHASDVAKLRSVSDATHRHLWLWVEPHEGMPILRSFDAEGLPTEDIDCGSLDGLWLGSGSFDERVAGVYWLRGSGWRDFETEMTPTLN